MNCVPDLLFDTSELASLSPLGGHARLAIRRNCAYENATLVAPRFADAGLSTINLPMMFTPAIGLDELESLGRVLDAKLLGR
jgi:hypothetical protein